MRIDLFGRRLLSINEGPVENVQSVAKARDFRIAGQGSMYVPDLTQDPNRTFKKMRDLRNIYLQGAYISEGVDLYPLYTIGAGYTLEIDEEKGDGEQAKADVEDFLNSINVYDITWQMMVDAITVRDGIAEIVPGRGTMAGKPVNVIPRPAECFEFDTNKAGTINQYIQRNANNGESLGTPVILNRKQVLHYQFMSRPDSPYGISLIERVIHDIKRDTRVIEATANGICLHGTPKWQPALNKNRPDAAKVSDAEWTDFCKQFEDITSKDNFPTEGDIELKMIDTSGVPNVQQYSDVSLARVVSGMGIPGELLGLRQGTTDATAVTRVGAFFKKIKSCQRDVEQMWNTVIDMRTGVPGLVKMVLNDTDPQDFAKLAAAMAALRQGTDPDAVCPADWCRDQLGIPEDERTDEEKPKRQEFDPSMGVNEWASLKGRVEQMPGGHIEEETAALDKLTQAAKSLEQATHIDERLAKIERQLADSDVEWITVNGQHIPIQPGQSKGDAVKQALGGKGGSGDAGGSSSKSGNSNTGGSISGRDTAGHKEIHSIESKIHSDTSESAAVYSKSGEKIIAKGGTNSEVQFSKDEMSKMKGGIFTHNHPPDAKTPTFSPADYGFAANADLSEMRAVSGDRVYVFTPGEKGWPPASKVSDSLATHLESNARKLSADIKSGKITKSDAEKKVWKATWSAVSKECGFGYTVEARAK